MVQEVTFLIVKGKGKVFPVQAIRHIWTAEVQLHSLASALNAGEWLSSHPSHYVPRKEPQYPLNMILGGLQSWSAHFGEEKNLSSLLGFKPQTVQPTAHSLYPPHHPDSFKNSWNQRSISHWKLILTFMFPVFVMVSSARPYCTTTVIPEQSSGLHPQHNIRCPPLYSLWSPSSPLRAVPAKNTVPSSATRTACRPSCPMAKWTILGDLLTGSSDHLPVLKPPCLMPRLEDLPQYRI